MRLIRPDFKITKEHGILQKKGDFVMTAVYHPSALLRDVSKRPEAFDDLISLRNKCRELGI
jgi:DNA polymerase